MKKSEAIEAIIAEIGEGLEPTQVIAERILNKLEELGMSPPDCNHYNSEYGEWRYWEEEK